jgi:predicted nucleotidyltransferase
MKIGNLSVPVVSKEDLIKLKIIAGRPQDLEDINALRRL